MTPTAPVPLVFALVVVLNVQGPRGSAVDWLGRRMSLPAPCSPWNLPLDPWPGSVGGAQLLPTEDGLLVVIPEGAVLRSDALCAGTAGRIRTVFRALSHEAWLGVELRRVQGDGATGGLSVDLEPGRRRVRVVRWLRSAGHQGVQPILRWAGSDAIPPAGSWTTLDVKLEDGLLTVIVEGTALLSHRVHHTWEGGHGLRLGGPTVGDGTVELKSIEAWNIVEQHPTTLRHFRVGGLGLPIDSKGHQG